jgi:chromosomal replication initiator protein
MSATSSGQPAQPAITVGAILRAVSATFEIRETEILSERRMQRSCIPRHAVMGLARDLTPYSLPRIGRALGRDHTTVLNGIGRHEARLAQDPDYAARIRAVSERLQRSLSDA